MKTKRNIFRNIAEVLKINGVKTSIAAAAVAAALLLPGARANAIEQNSIITMEIPTSMMMSWSDTGSSVNLTGEARVVTYDLMEGEKTFYGGTLQVYSNIAYELTVRANDAVFSGGSNTKPASDMKLEFDANGTPVQIDGTNDVLLYTSAGPEVAAEHVIDYTVNLNPATDAPGTYTIILFYTLRAAI